ncbi:plant viral-response family protein (DUF716) [Tasmannia lanceolata]|uniref:plant viral-response family protein (DUF716) n=1 Tax=Tasmannia lanceolata TaxID=3420 RepID=UPI00406460D3
MASLLSHIFSSSALFSLGLYHLVLSTRSHIKSPQTYLAKPYHPFPFPFPRFRHLPLYLILLSLLLSIFHQTLLSSLSDPLIKGRTPVHHFSSLQSASVLFLFFLLTLALLISESTPLFPIPSDLIFTIASAAFALHFFVASASSSVQTSSLQAKCESIAALISASSSLLTLTLAYNPKLYVADLALGASICLKGLWVLQTGLSLYVEAFIPEGCHRLLDVVSGVEGSTKCDLEESTLRAVALLDLVFVLHVTFVSVIVVIAYAVVAKAVGVRRIGSYEALPTSSAGLVGLDPNHVQMKAFNQDV